MKPRRKHCYVIIDGKTGAMGIIAYKTYRKAVEVNSDPLHMKDNDYIAKCVIVKEYKKNVKTK